MRSITEADLDDIAAGAAVLGSGGGGDPYVGKLLAREALRAHGEVMLLDLDEVDPDDVVVPIGIAGAPTVTIERPPSGEEVALALRALEPTIGRATATVSIEIGGLDGLLPIAAAAQAGLALLDGDLMGRAFSEIQMCLPGVLGVPAAPTAVADHKGNVTTIDAGENLTVEHLMRALLLEMGGVAYVAIYPMSGRVAGASVVGGTVTLAQDIGAIMRQAQAEGEVPVEPITERLGGLRLFDGKVVEVSRSLQLRSPRAAILLNGVGDDRGERIRVYAQDEYLVVQREAEIVASVPDLIIFLDSATGSPVSAEDVQPGDRVSVLAVPCDERYRTPAALAVVGPRYFGYGFDFIPVESRGLAT